MVAFVATLSINLGLINLFPIPLLDGGHLMFYAIEAVAGRPPADGCENMATVWESPWCWGLWYS